MAESESGGFLDTLSQISGPISSLLQGGMGIYRMGQAADIQVAGAEATAQGFRISGVASRQAAEYNAQLDMLDTNRRRDALARVIGRTMSAQRVQAASSALAITSGSYLDVMNDTITTFERQAHTELARARQRQQSILYEGAVKQTQYENQARAAAYQGQVAAWVTKQKQGSALADFIPNAANTITNVFKSFSTPAAGAK